MDEQKKQILTDLKEIRDDLSEKKQEVNVLNDQKEEVFSEKSDLRKEIIKLIQQVKEYKSVRDECTNQVKELKVKRDEINADIKALIDKHQDILKDHPDLAKVTNAKPKRKVNVPKLKKIIESLEFKLQTSVMSFDKEKQINKEIKDLQGKIAGAGESSDVEGQVAELSRQISKKKKAAKDIHKQVTELATRSQDNHTKVIEISKQIDELKEDENKLAENFNDLKKQYSDKRKEKIEIEKKLKGVRGDLNKDREEKKQISEEAKKEIIKEKQGEVEDKIKSGKKLSTEDLLAFQMGN